MTDLENVPTASEDPDGPATIPGPVLSVCGWSGSGKTTVLRQVIPATQISPE